MRTDCRVVLVGMMGSGKTTVGTLLAHELGWPYHDNDALLARLRGGTAKELLADGGLRELRLAEADALRIGLAQDAPCIIGAPAGTVTDPGSMAVLTGDPLVVWLTASPRTLARRARDSIHRPWLEGDAAEWMERTLAERTPLYESIADLVVDTERNDPAAVAAEVASWVRERCA